MANGIAIACVGDLMMELFAPSGQGPQVQRTYILDSATAAVGGAALNLCWYLGQLRRSSTMVSGFGTMERSCVEAALTKANVDIAALVQLSGKTDVLVVLPGQNLPAVYIRGQIVEQELAALADRMCDRNLIIFAGSRHENFRNMILQKVREIEDAMFVFSPSYSIYDFGYDELKAFMMASDITIINEHEAKYLVQLFSKTGNTDLMQLPKRGGIVTLGPGGVDIFRDGRLDHVASISGREEDVIGAGEAFLAGFIHEYVDSGIWERSATVGCAVAAQVVRTDPTQVRAMIDSERLRKDISSYSSLAV